MRAVRLIFVAMALSGCTTNGYQAFYSPNPDAPSLLENRKSPAPAVPAVDHVAGGFEHVAHQYYRTGYVAIGHSSFNSGRSESEKGALKQATMVQADRVVIINPEYTGSSTSSIPLTLPTTQTSASSGSATIYDAGGSSTVYGNSTTTTYGTSTTYVPITTHRYDYGALYFVKINFIFGAWYVDLTDSERQTLRTNKGVRVTTIVNDSPAYVSDVLVGDMILTLNGRSVSGGDAFMAMLKEHRGRTVELLISRSGESVTKSVALGQ